MSCIARFIRLIFSLTRLDGIFGSEKDRNRMLFRSDSRRDRKLASEHDTDARRIRINGARTDPFHRAGVAHLYFVTIHPFADGNGRIARALTDMALAEDERSARRLYSLSRRIHAVILYTIAFWRQFNGVTWTLPNGSSGLLRPTPPASPPPRGASTGRE